MGKEIYVSVDIEADGPIPGQNSMLSFGAAAFDANGKLLGTFTRNLDPLTGALPDIETMKWWDSQGDAYAKTRENTVGSGPAIANFLKWIDDICKPLKAKPVFVGYPVTYDFMWVYWYIVHFGFKSPFSHSGLDMKTMAMGLLNKQFRDIGKRSMPDRWKNPANKHTHIALDDAIEQGEMFCKMLAEVRESGKIRDVLEEIEPTIGRMIAAQHLFNEEARRQGLDYPSWVTLLFPNEAPARKTTV